MIIHLLKTCSAFEYKERLDVVAYSFDKKSGGSIIIVEYNGRSVKIPVANIIGIE